MMEAALELFAEHGYAGVSVGQIEQAAGLAPRSGALYHYFRSKQDLLHAALMHASCTVDELEGVLGMLPLGDLRAELVLLARWNMTSLQRRTTLTRFLTTHGAEIPEDLRAEMYDRLCDRPYQLIRAWLRERLVGVPGAEQLDVDATVLVLVESMAGYRTLSDVFGRVPGEVDDERFVQAWVDTAAALATSVGLTPPDPSSADAVATRRP